MELLHECRGDLKALQLSQRRLPRRLSIAEYGEHIGPMAPISTPYYESYECRDCMTRILIAK